MRTSFYLYLGKLGATRITKKRGKTLHGEICIHVSLDVPDELFFEPELYLDVSLPDPPELPPIEVRVHDAVQMASRIQADVHQIAGSEGHSSHGLEGNDDH